MDNKTKDKLWKDKIESVNKERLNKIREINIYYNNKLIKFAEKLRNKE